MGSAGNEEPAVEPKGPDAFNTTDSGHQLMTDGGVTGRVARRVRGALTTKDTDPEVTATPDEAFTVLANSRRRATIQIIANAVRTGEDTPSIGEVSRRIAADEGGIHPSAVTARQRKAVYIALYQHHLDKLDDVGVIEYDERSGSIDPTPATCVLADAIEHVTVVVDGGDR